jgi:hypothetical protein
MYWRAAWFSEAHILNVTPSSDALHRAAIIAKEWRKFSRFRHEKSDPPSSMGTNAFGTAALSVGSCAESACIDPPSA